MRTIKFRFWDKKRKQMIDKRPYTPDHYEYLYINPEGNVEITHRGLPEYTKDFILMQFTGLLDRTNKEIYEGDIVEIKEENEPYWMGEVIWDVYRWDGDGFYMSHYDNPGELFSQGTKYIAVIGNIYENPELINKK